MPACMVVHACVMRAGEDALVCVRVRAHVGCLLERACTHTWFCACACQAPEITGLCRRPPRSGAEAGVGAYSAAALGAHSSHASYSSSLYPGFACNCQGPAQSHAPTAGRTQSRSPHPEPDILRCDKRGRRCAFCVGMPAWNRSACENLAARRSPVLRAPPSATVALNFSVQLKFKVIGRPSSSPWARWADLRDWNRSVVLLQLLDVHTWGRNQL